MEMSANAYGLMDYDTFNVKLHMNGKTGKLKSLFVRLSVQMDFHTRWRSGRALDLRLEMAGSIPAAALSSATLNKLFTHIVQRL